MLTLSFVVHDPIRTLRAIVQEIVISECDAVTGPVAAEDNLVWGMRIECGYGCINTDRIGQKLILLTR